MSVPVTGVISFPKIMNSFSARLFIAMAVLFVMAGPTRIRAEVPEVAGIGVYLGTDSGSYPRIIKVIPDSPAAKMKLEEGQVITKVDGVSTAEKTITDCVEMIRGKEGSAVVLEIRGADGKTFQRLILRKKIAIPE